MLVDLTIKGFLAETAGSAPVPGGGSISALNGAIATALTEMVANLTIGKKKYADVEGQMRTIATEAAIIRERLIRDIDRDSEAYDRVFAAFKLPKERRRKKPSAAGLSRTRRNRRLWVRWKWPKRLPR